MISAWPRQQALSAAMAIIGTSPKPRSMLAGSARRSERYLKGGE